MSKLLVILTTMTAFVCLQKHDTLIGPDVALFLHITLHCKATADPIFTIIIVIVMFHMDIKLVSSKIDHE